MATGTVRRDVVVEGRIGGKLQAASFSVATGSQKGDFDEAVRLFKRYLWWRIVWAHDEEPMDVIVDRIEAVSKASFHCVSYTVTA